MKASIGPQPGAKDRPSPNPHRPEAVRQDHRPCPHPSGIEDHEPPGGHPVPRPPVLANPDLTGLGGDHFVEEWQSREPSNVAPYGAGLGYVLALDISKHPFPVTHLVHH